MSATCTRGADHTLSPLDQIPAGDRLFECTSPDCRVHLIIDTDGVRHLIADRAEVTENG